VKNSGWWKGAAKYAVAVVLLAFVVSMNWTALNDLFSRPPHLECLAAVAAISVGCTSIQFYRWYLLVRALDFPFALRDAVRLGLVGLFYNSFLPGSIGGDVVKAYFVMRGHPERKAAAFATVVADRLIGLFGLILFSASVGGACWAAGNEKIAGNPTLQGIVLVCVGLAAVAVGGYVGLGFLSPAWAERFGGRLAGVKKVGPTLAELWYTARQYRTRPGVVAAAVAMSAVVHTGFVFMFHLATRVFPPANPELLGTLPEHFVVIPIGFIAQAIIPLPGGLGLGELTFGGLYGLIRGKEGEAIGLGGRLTLRVVEWTIALIGYVVYLRMTARLPAPAPDGPTDPDDRPDRPARVAAVPDSLTPAP
jgi:uncharacterized membrane protein YbhN (UPF0104 family)